MGKNYIYKWLIVINFFITSNTSIIANPQKNALVFDMDEVFADLNTMGVLSQSLWYLVKNPTTLFALLSTDLWTKFAALGKQSFSAESMGNLAKDYPVLQPDFDQLMHICHGQRRLYLPLADLLVRLKQQGYILFVATNRDRMAFELTAQSLGLNTYYKGGQLFDHSITAHQSNYKDATTNKEGKRFSALSFRLPNDYITEVNGFKPKLIYYQAMRKTVDALFAKKGIESPRIIFFDDNKDNVDAANNAFGLNIKAFLVPPTERAEALYKDLEGMEIGTRKKKQELRAQFQRDKFAHNS